MSACVAALSIAGPLERRPAAKPGQLAVRVQPRLDAAGSVHVSFHPADHLPPGGYYYAVIVLKPYRHFTRAAPPRCATSSNMEKTDYGFPQPAHALGLALTRTASAQHRWCPGGTYIGAIYAVRSAPPCNGTHPCRSESYEASPCFELEGGRRVCGVVVRPRVYAYPDGLPSPLEQSTHIVGRFQLTFRSSQQP